MPDSLPVAISRDDLHDLDVPLSFETAGSFDIALDNHGEGVHVHLHLDDTLSRVATLDASNHYVDRDAERLVYVDVDDVTDPIEGKLKVVSAYGAQTRYIDLTIRPPSDDPSSVHVDESLAQPQPRERDPSPAVAAVDDPETLVVILGALALAVALVAAVVVQSQAVVVGSLIVLAGVLGAVYNLVR